MDTAPSEMAQIDASPNGPTALKVRIHGAALRRGRPLFSNGVVVMTYVGAQAPVDETLWTLQGSTSRSTFDVTFPADTAPGTTVWVAAAYLNAKLQAGPLTYPPVQLRLAGSVNATTVETAVKLAA